MFSMEMDEIILLFSSPFFLVDATLEVVVVTFPALFAIAALNAVFLLHDSGNLTPAFDFSHFVDFFENLVLLRIKNVVPMLSRSFFHTFLMSKIS